MRNLTVGEAPTLGAPRMAKCLNLRLDGLGPARSGSGRAAKAGSLVLALALGTAALAGGGLATSAAARTAPAAHAQAGRAMVVSDLPDATAAGLAVLKAGGAAADAAVAIQAVLGLEEPESCGLAGGAFVIYYDAARRRTTVYNGRETAPASAGPALFMDEAGKPLNFVAAITSGRSTGAPGAVAMLARLHADHGRRPWSSLFKASETLARDGFVVSKKMGGFINSHFPQAVGPDATAYFTKPDGARYQTGEVMKNPAYAKTVALLARTGPKALYGGPLGRDIAARVAQGPIPGALTEEDIAAYRPEVSAPLCRPYRQYRVCAAPAPSGGPGVLELLSILEHTDIADRGPKDPQAWYLFAQASRLMYADRDYFEGDPDFVTVPTAGLIDAAYGAERASRIDAFAQAAPEHGLPSGAPKPGPDATREPGGTSHIIIVDRAGNMVTMTTTVESIFGSGRMTDGFFLNNQLTDFSAPVAADGTPAANAPGPRKRPRSSMSPVLVFDAEGRPVAALGSPGGNSIIAYVAKTLVAWIDWKMPLQEAVNLPNLVARGTTVSVEKGMDPAIVTYLQAKNLPVRAEQGENSGLNGVVLHKDGFEMAADPRRNASAKSQ